MKICITSVGKDLNAPVDPRFGRCANFIIVDTETMEFRVIPNMNASQMGGAGIQAAKDVISEGVKAVISGAIGPNAIDVFKSSGIEFYSAIRGSVMDNINAFKDGRLQVMYGPTVPGHFGQGGFGRGGGRGGRW